MKNFIRKIKDWVKDLLDVAFSPTLGMLPGQIAFFLVLSIFPLLTLIGMVLSMFDVSVSSLIETINSALPAEIATTLVSVISGKSFDSSVGISMIMAFILASNGAHAIILASNTLYGFPPDDFIKRRVKALFLIILLVLLFAFTILVLVYGNIIATTIKDFINFPPIADTIYTLFVIFKWPVAMILMYFNIKLIYVIAPDWQILSKNTTKGALFTTAGWTIATAIYSYYVSHFARYDIFYGGLSNIVILMMWVYVISYVLVIGIAINVQEYRDKEEE